MHVNRVVVVHESMFGNTRRIAEAVARGGRDVGLDVQVASVTDLDPHDVPTDALLVVAAPTHAFGLSRPNTRADAVRQGALEGAATIGMREWLAGLPAAEGHLAAVLDTRVRKVRRVRANAARSAAKALHRKGYHLLARPEGFQVEDTAGPLTDGEEERAAGWGRALVRTALALAPHAR